MLRRICIYLTMSMLCMFMTGCGTKDETTGKIRDLDFTVVATQNIPEELLEVLESEKADVFHKTYSDGDYMYLCVGYGEQETGGYSITVNELYLTNDSIYMDTTLVGPSPEETPADSCSYPYIVICTEYMECPIIFE